MKKEELLDNLQSIVSALRKELAQDHKFTMDDISRAAKLSMESAKAYFSGDNDIKDAMHKFKQEAEKAEQSMKQGNKDLANKALDNMEKLIASLRSKVN